MKLDTDILVVGGGIIGLMAASYAAKSSQSVTLVEQHFPGTQEGSSAGHIRMFRTMYNEIELSQMAYQSGDLYAEIEAETGRKILHHKGLLNFGAQTEYTREGTLLAPIETLKTLGKPYELLDKAEIERRYPFKNLPEHYVGIFQPDNAATDVKEAIATALGLCRDRGVEIRTGAKVTRLDNQSDHVVAVLSDGQRITARKVIATPGPYANELLAPSFDFSLDLSHWDMCSAFYRTDGSVKEYPMWVQFDNPLNGYSNLFYGQPNCDFGRPGFVNLGVVWASHQFSDVSQRRYAPPSVDLEIVRAFVAERMRGVDTAPVDVIRGLTVLLPDNGCILDYLPSDVPNNRNVVVCTGGWAFKFAPLFGKICAELALEQEVSAGIESLSINRPGRVATRAKHIDLSQFQLTAAE